MYRSSVPVLSKNCVSSFPWMTLHSNTVVRWNRTLVLCRLQFSLSSINAETDRQNVSLNKYESDEAYNLNKKHRILGGRYHPWTSLRTRSKLS
jgi:hypothetical protein